MFQAHPIACLLEVPQMESSDMKKHMNNLLEEACEGDLLHDVIFQVRFTLFPRNLQQNKLPYLRKSNSNLMRTPILKM